MRYLNGESNNSDFQGDFAFFFLVLNWSKFYRFNQILSNIEYIYK